ncbi:hypothetical protein [Gilvimarinus sp. DA14]|uniref:hypothetical protein n=1 Tax=Gilvimarinus sp. DA14 TaxID=2956798 RepID=UPI0020B88893|nr:hypothetical protein [Gilvimarinus sp. DA14]UTF59661.1 hypothetical protein NHM04_14480 [Gilvimarinus sp. DA14]
MEKGAYLLELARYVVLNPVRARMVAQVSDWPWTSYNATVGQARAAEFLQVHWLLSNFGRRKSSAIAKYKKFVAEGVSKKSPWCELSGQVLGSDEFVEQSRELIRDKKLLDEVPRAQYRPEPASLSFYEHASPSRNEAMAKAYASGGYTLKEIGAHFGLHYSAVSVLVRNQKSKT